MNVTAKALISRYESLSNKRRNWETMWDELSTYILPNKTDFIAQRTRGTKRSAELHDSTAVHAAQLLAASLQGTLTSAATEWFALRFRDNELNENTEAKEWLEKCEHSINQELNQSNFNTEVGETYLDLVVFGTAPLLMDVKTEKGQFGGFNFRSLHLSNVVIDENADGKVDTVFRKFTLTARQSYQMFGDDCGEKVKACLEKDPDKEFDYIHAIFPREMKGEFAMIAPPKMRPFASYYVNMIDKKICQEGGNYELNILAPRWSKVTGDVYGYSPACIARADIKTLNEARKLAMTAWEKSIDPPLLAPRNSIFGTLSYQSSTVNYVSDPQQISAMPNGTNWNADQLMLNDVRSSVRRIFFADQLELQNSPTMTATEVQVRYELMQRLLGSTLGRLQSEFLTPLVERAFYAMLRANVLPMMPQVISEMGGDLDIEYVGALARSQRVEEVTSIQRLAESAMMLAQLNPDVLDIIDTDKAGRTISDRLGVPAEVLRGKDEVEILRANRQQQQQQMMAQEQAQAELGQAEQVANIQQVMNG